MELFNINSTYGLCESLYGVTPDENEFEDLALEAWSRIGTKHTRLYRFVGSVENKTLQLPCNSIGDEQLIESVHVPIPDAQITSNSTNHPFENIWIESYIDHWIKRDDPYFERGKLVRYDEGDHELYFAHDYPKVLVIYHGILADEDGLPLINEKEQRAIAAFIAYHYLYKDGIKKRDANTIKLAQVVKEDWLRGCNAARVPEHMSQNDMNAILDAKTSWNRKNYGKSFFPTQ